MAKKITSLVGLAASLRMFAQSPAKLRKKIAEKLEPEAESRIFERGLNASDQKIGKYAASTTKKTGQKGDIKLQLTGKLRSKFGIDRRLNAPDFKFGSEAAKVGFIEDAPSLDTPVFELTDDEKKLVVNVIEDELKDLGLL